jgi:membrane protease subunit (stomatin/prohibitin family)
MGLIRAYTGAAGGTLADQWKDFITVPYGVSPTAAIFRAVHAGSDNGRGSNTSGSNAIISNGSKIVVPEGYGLLLLQNGELTGFVNDPGGYVWDVNDTYSQSIYAGNGFHASLVTQSWERFKFGGRPGSEQLALYVRMGELPNNRFGTQSEIYWDDAFLNTQVGAITHGTYSLRIVDPIALAKSFVPANYLQGYTDFDFTDRSNPAAQQIFAEVVSCLAAAFSHYTNNVARENRITKIQQDSAGFAQALSEVVEHNYHWRSTRGLEISNVTIVGIQYDDNTKELLKTVQRADALSGRRASSNLQASVAEGIQSAGATQGASGIFGVGIAAGATGIPEMLRESTNPPVPTPTAGTPVDLVTTLAALKQALEAGLIEQVDYDAAKNKALGL